MTKGEAVRIRIRLPLTLLGVVLAVFSFAGPAFAQEGEEHEFADEEAEECFEILEDGGKVDDCQEAPNPLVPVVNEIIWGSLAFLVLLVGMWKFGLPAVQNMMHAREERIREDLERAESAKTEAEGVLQGYEVQLADARNESGRIIDEGRQAGEQVRRDVIARADEEANEIRARAQADIELQRERALQELRAEVASMSIELASRIVERNLDSDTNRQLVDSFIQEVGSN
ncbi:MAG: F0F1 ATP synthase subunit B [Acidimicrobiia bacterium]